MDSNLLNMISRKLRHLFRSQGFLFIFIIIFSTSLILRVLPILNYNFPFTTDQGRDMLDIRNIIVGKNPTLIGPTTSINGVFLGPFWYYFNIIPFILGGGNPAYLVYWMIIWYQIAALIIWLYFKKSSPLLGLTLSSLFLMAPSLFYSSRYFWNANLIQVLTVFFFLNLLSCIKKVHRMKFFSLGLLAGLALQTEAAFGVLLLPFALFVLIFSRINWQRSAFLIFGFGLTLLPQLAFELRHNFLMTKVLLDQYTNPNAIQGVKLNFQEVIYSHRIAYLLSLNGVLQIPDQLSKYVFITIALLMSIFSLTKLTIRQYIIPFAISLSFIIFSFLAYLLYPYHLKGWYINSLHIPYLFICALFITSVINFKKKLVTIIIIVTIIGLYIQSAFIQLKLVPHGISDRSGDRSNYRNELEVIDWIYQRAGGKSFSVYNYLPSVYDYPYQYLFWWYGTSKYGYQPEQVTYLKNVPEYIPNNNLYWNKIRASGDNPLTFLIIEKEYHQPEFFSAWINNFNDLCIIEEKKFYWDSSIQVKQKCQEKLN